VQFQNGSNKVAIELRVVQILPEIILVISNRTRATRSFDFEITRMISDQISLLWVQLPLYSYQFSARTSVTCCSKVICFTIREKVVPRRIYANLTALNLLYFKDLFVNGLYSSYTRKGSTGSEDVVNKETYGAVKGTLYKQFCLAECLIFRTIFAIDGYV